MNFTIEKILKGIDVNGEVRVASYGDLIKRHLREEATIILVRDAVNLEIRKPIIQTHIDEGESDAIDCVKICTDAQALIKQFVIEDINANAHKFKSLEPSDSSNRSSILDKILDNAYHLVAQNVLDKLQNNMQSLEYRKGDDGNATRRVILECGSV